MKYGKFLTLILRHKPSVVGVDLNIGGWVLIDDLLDNMNNMGYEITINNLLDVVKCDSKGRFEIKDGLIRATQGHSIDINLGLEPLEPPKILYHGTISENIGSIMSGAIKKMERHAVHLSEDINTAVSVGGRRGKPVVIIVDSNNMYKHGFKFYKSINGVWLTDEVPSKYLKINK